MIKQLGKFLIISATRSLVEGLSIAESAGVDATAAVKMLTETLFPSPIYRSYGAAIAEKSMSSTRPRSQPRTLASSVS